MWNSIFFVKISRKNDVDEIAEIVRMFTVHLSYHYFGIFTRSLNQLESNKILKFQKSNGWRVFSRRVNFFYSNFSVLVRRSFLGPVLVQGSLISSMSLGQRLNEKTCSIKTSSTLMWFCCGIPRRARHETNCRSTKSTKLDSNLKKLFVCSASVHLAEFGWIYRSLLEIG